MCQAGTVSLGTMQYCQPSFHFIFRQALANFCWTQTDSVVQADLNC